MKVALILLASIVLCYGEATEKKIGVVVPDSDKPTLEGTGKMPDPKKSSLEGSSTSKTSQLDGVKEKKSLPRHRRYGYGYGYNHGYNYNQGYYPNYSYNYNYQYNYGQGGFNQGFQPGFGDGYGAGMFGHPSVVVERVIVSPFK